MKTSHEGSGGKPITIYHNPACGTSRNALQAIIDAGFQPQVVRYLEKGWRREQLLALLSAMGLGARDLLRLRGTPAEELGLTRSSASDDTVLDAMVAHPILVKRPIVVTPKGVALCRPWEKVKPLL